MLPSPKCTPWHIPQCTRAILSVQSREGKGFLTGLQTGRPGTQSLEECKTTIITKRTVILCKTLMIERNSVIFKFAFCNSPQFFPILTIVLSFRLIITSSVFFCCRGLLLSRLFQLNSNYIHRKNSQPAKKYLPSFER